MQKKFEPADLDVLQQLNGAKISNLFFQLTDFSWGPNLLIFHFTTKQGKKLTLRAACFVRIASQNKLLLTSSDEFTDVHYNDLAEENENNLLKHNIDVVLPMLSTTEIADVKVTQTADVILQTENGLTIAIKPDANANGHEYYSFFSTNNSDEKPYVVFNRMGEILFRR